ncbi:MAG: sensor histidine kinase, partial [Phycisphaeraceae bacterium]|nr:sensor histidine kinase [Phycisphaeraceae bacterium]
GQPTWSDLPVILLVEPEGPRRAWKHPSVKRPSVQWLFPPLKREALRGMVQLAIESRRRQLQIAHLLEEKDRLNQRLTQRTQQLQRMTVRLIEAEDKERARLAEMLHEDLQQLLVSARMHLRAAKKNLKSDSNERLILNEVRQLIQQAQQTSRNTSHELFPQVLQQSDLIDVLQWIQMHSERLFGIHMRLAEMTIKPRVAPTVLRFIYRSLREILCNAAKYAGVEHVQVDLVEQPGRLEVIVTDRGKGFDPSLLARARPETGMGLMAIRERVESLGGLLEIDSVPGRGTRIVLTVPTQGSDDPAETATESPSEASDSEPYQPPAATIGEGG